jgi:hypothetical protein
MILRDQRPSTVKTRGCEQHHGVGELTDIKGHLFERKRQHRPS